MIGTLVSFVINAGAFFAISRLLPGFTVKNERTAILIALLYSLIGSVSMIFVAPLMAVVMLFLAFLVFIPVIGPLLFAGGFGVTIFLISFIVSAVLLIVIDKILDDFEMNSWTTAFIASFLLAVINVGIRMILPGI